MIVLHNMDCFDFLPTIKSNSVDLVLIDPHYEISRTSNFAAGEITGREFIGCEIDTEFYNKARKRLK